ncbi:MAG: M3 family metallopeptidase [bacterium]|nr:M3 family metallopeptidase [bacterium]
MAAKEVLSAELREQLRFDLTGRLVKDEEQFESLMKTVEAITDRLALYEGKITSHPHECLAFLQLREEMDEILGKLWTYRLLDESVDTRKQGVTSTLQTRLDPISARLVFADLELKAISEATWNEWLTTVPQLSGWTEMMRRLWREIPHTLSRTEEELLAQLSAPLSAWHKDLYQTLVSRTQFAEFEVDGQTLNAMRDQSALMLVKDRAIREKAWNAFYEGYAEHRDLFAFGFNRVVQTGNLRARLAKFDDALHAQAHYIHLTRDQVAGLWNGLDAMTPLLRRYTEADCKRRSIELGITDIEPWDLEQEAADFEQPQYTASQAFDDINEALALLGNDVERELKKLLDPKEGRIDMYGGPNRRPGAFSISPGKTPGFFYLDQYHGTIDQVRTIAHEAGHTVHHTLMNAKGLPSYASDGPTYVTETAAMTFEEIYHHHLLERETNPKIRQFLMQKQLADMISVIRIGWIARFEADVYTELRNRNDDGKGLLTPEEFDQLAEPSAKARSIFYPKYKQPLALWQVVHHYYTVPLYNLNYLISSLLTMELAGRVANDKGFAKNIANLFSHPFDQPTADILRNTVGIDFARDDWYKQAVANMEKYLSEFEQYVATLKK